MLKLFHLLIKLCVSWFLKSNSYLEIIILQQIKLIFLSLKNRNFCSKTKLTKHVKRGFFCVWLPRLVYSGLVLPMDLRYNQLEVDTECSTTELRGRSPTPNPNFSVTNPKTLAQRVHQISHIDHDGIAGTYHCCRDTGPLLGIDYPGMTNCLRSM